MQEGAVRRISRKGYRIDGAMVRRLREEREWPRSELQWRTGISLNHLLRIELGRAEWVGRDTLDAIVEALGVPAERIVLERRGRFRGGLERQLSLAV